MTIKALRAGSLLLIVGGVLLGCVGAPQVTVEERRAYDEAMAALPTDPIEAGRRIEFFLRTHRDSPLAEPAAVKRAELALAEGDRNTAMFWLDWAVRHFPQGEYSDDARLDLAQLAFQRSEVGKARKLLRVLRPRRLTAARQRLLYRLRAELSEDRVERLQTRRFPERPQ